MTKKHRTSLIILGLSFTVFFRPLFPGEKNIDLEKQGYQKLLGGGITNSALKINVKSATEKAIEKIKEKGGEVTILK